VAARQKAKNQQAPVADQKVEVGELTSNYEMVVIARPGATETDDEQIAENVKQLVSNSGGTVNQVEPWGKKKFAYPVNHLTEGYYLLLRFEMPPSSATELESKLKINEQILRHLLVVEGS
jgi:small subunit ribosomal protein S6